ncbi:ABC transporter permease [Citromicrobium bathyomarinum]|uniref:ABC transporter permease n=1 Tax=unclassified Citromicrobium TaxID=2630544 RepID=UPI0006C8F704|nr:MULTISPECIES: ABC transporter permease [unclassified Citromicrobium]KPM24451.1 ABC transporter permease [Citromicrobium sp. RCC1885]KPM27693.1 ABC transporter permease [Citromicrobium sp. RCC1878]MAO05307.1 ABC transporter permease [Citromicrobium sp.]OAM10814.1 ABC transporter permease [Citromicrobium sp. RCC1897]|tara:strand:+ start:6205 stop:7434 length:1230 start_codon:yes stop_codon:yes gene_type:complete
MSSSARLSLWQAAWVIARRDFTAIVFSKVFLLFLIGPLFFLGISAGGGYVGAMAADSADEPQLAVAFTPDANAAIERVRDELEPLVGMPEVTLVDRADGADPRALLEDEDRNLLGVLSGSLADPLLTGPKEDVERWEGEVAIMVGAARGEAIPQANIAIDMTDGAINRQTAQDATARAGIVMLFMLTIFLAGMVLSNLVEEKGNKIIEILAAAIPMDAVFVGKLFAMLGVSLVGLTVWGAAAGVILILGAGALPVIPPPAVGWPLFFALFVIYFAMAYLLIGSVFLAVGSLAPTVRDVQTVSMPATILQLVIFFLANFAVGQPGSALEIFAAIFPLSSPYMMVARAAKEGVMWWHLAAIAWQVLWVAIFVKIGASLFRAKVLKSGSAGREKGAGRKGLLALFGSASNQS